MFIIWLSWNADTLRDPEKFMAFRDIEKQLINEAVRGKLSPVTIKEYLKAEKVSCFSYIFFKLYITVLHANNFASYPALSMYMKREQRILVIRVDDGMGESFVSLGMLRGHQRGSSAKICAQSE